MNSSFWSVSSDLQSDLVCLVQARLVRVLHVVSGDEFGGVIKLCGKEPRSFFVGTCITSPADKVQELAVTPSPINLRVKDFLNFIFNFSVNLDQRQQRLDPIWNGARVGEFELGDVEDGVHRFHSVGESECEGMTTGLCYDCEGSKVLVKELLGGARRTEVLGFHIHFISYLEIWQNGSSGVCRTLITLLR